ncbi:MAG: hypothetical protein JEZ11_23400 [Desulfobacterales bacterium]|nr:hypothetical protein [Desulfobacterales bacterium]
MTTIGTIINFCSLDHRFIGPCVQAVAPFSSHVVVPWADHLFDNTPEDLALIARSAAENPEAEFVPFAYHHSITEMLRSRFWHNYARWVGLARLAETCDWVLFLDADEIVETDRFTEFLARSEFHRYDHLYFANYWYFREPRFRARQIEDSPAMVKRDIVTVNRIFHENERTTFRRLPNGLRRVAGIDGRPMFHHYSWVMDQARMRQKVRTWGHSLDTDRDWDRLVEEEFSREFSGKDFVHGYDFDEVEPLISLADVEENARTASDLNHKLSMPERSRIASIDLAPLSRHVADPDDRAYFLDTDFKEHYRLLAWLSTLYQGATLFDIGTYRGSSALALSYNGANRVVSYDIETHLTVRHRQALETIEFTVGDVLSDARLLDSPLILMDIGHDGESEQRIYDYLDRKGYQGLLVLDDIHLNPAMRRFWNGIQRLKRDITDLGHVTGTGLVFFGRPPLWAAFADPGQGRPSITGSEAPENGPVDPFSGHERRSHRAVFTGAAARPGRGLRIGFHANQLGFRGTDVALYDYAWFNRELLGNQSVIISDRNADLTGIERFQGAFDVLLYDDFSQVEPMVAERGLDAVYFLKSGVDDGKTVRTAKTLVHAAFQVCQPHGDVYAYVSGWLAGKMGGGRYPWVPHMVRLPETDHDFRGRLGIPETARVFGRHGGRDQFNIPFVGEVVRRVAEADPDIYFLFMNTDRFCDPLANIIHLNPTWDIDAKAGFINTCDAMLHARIQGETFGLAIAEFLLKDKPVIAWADGIDQNHLAMLGDRGRTYGNPTELFDCLTGFKRVEPKGWYQELVRDFTPEKVMQSFKAVFLDAL